MAMIPIVIVLFLVMASSKTQDFLKKQGESVKKQTPNQMQRTANPVRNANRHIKKNTTSNSTQQTKSSKPVSKEKDTIYDRTLATARTCLQVIQQVFHQIPETSRAISRMDREFVREFKQLSSTFENLDYNDLLNYAQKVERFVQKNSHLPTDVLDVIKEALGHIRQAQKDIIQVEGVDAFEEPLSERTYRSSVRIETSKGSVRQALIWKEILDKPKSLKKER